MCFTKSKTPINYVENTDECFFLLSAVMKGELFVDALDSRIPLKCMNNRHAKLTQNKK